MTLAEEFAYFVAAKYNKVVSVVGSTVNGTVLGNTIEKVVGPNGRSFISKFSSLPTAPNPKETK